MRLDAGQCKLLCTDIVVDQPWPSSFMDPPEVEALRSRLVSPPPPRACPF